jgi:endonuclease/exonuclease/phosphatase family metal-dependent hydrolase
MSDKTFRIASYNIRKARGLDQKRLPERTLQVVNELDADMVVLQEADKRLGKRPPAIPRHLIQSETDFDLVEVSHNGTSLGWHGNAVLVRKGVAVSEIKRLDLPGMEPRGAVQVDISSFGGFSLIAAHLGLLRRDRQAQLRALCHATQNNKHSVIAGDFNEWSASKGMDPLAERFNLHAPGSTFPTRRPMAALDRFALSKDVKMHRSGVVQDGLARLASDHLPIWSDITLS